MRRLFMIFTATILLTAGPGPSWSDERQLTAAEIDRRLAGNSIEGAWKGKPYRQYFDRSGGTIYQYEGEPTSNGKWQARASTNQYCSQWGPGAWACYYVFSDGPEGIIWRVPSDGYRAPAKILNGRKLY